MNIIAGMMMPETNWAPKLAWYSSSFFSSNAASTSRWRPNTLTSACPVNASSMWALSSPVCAHCAMNCGCDRLRDLRGDRRPTAGTVTSAISASSGEIKNIIDQHADRRSAAR